jgi:transcriptional regulator with XRE-family HTH domain
MAKRKTDELGRRALDRLLELWGPERPGRLTQREIAQQTGYSQQEISLVLNRRRPLVPLAMLDAIAGVFGESLISLLTMPETAQPRARADAARAALQKWAADAPESALFRVLEIARTSDQLQARPMPARVDAPLPPRTRAGSGKP